MFRNETFCAQDFVKSIRFKSKLVEYNAKQSLNEKIDYLRFLNLSIIFFLHSLENLKKKFEKKNFLKKIILKSKA